MAAKFEIRSPKPGEYQWVLLSQGRTLATGETYKRRATAAKAIGSFRTAAVAAPLVDTSLRPAKTPAGKTARATGRVLARAVVKSGRAVEKAEKAAAGASKRAAKATGDVLDDAADAVRPTGRATGRAKKHR